MRGRKLVRRHPKSPRQAGRAPPPGLVHVALPSIFLRIHARIDRVGVCRSSYSTSGAWVNPICRLLGVPMACDAYPPRRPRGTRSGPSARRRGCGSGAAFSSMADDNHLADDRDDAAGRGPQSGVRLRPRRRWGRRGWPRCYQQR
jgi:hypothetical protein